MGKKKSSTTEKVEKVYITKVPVQLHVAVQGVDVDSARDAVFQFVAALNHTQKANLTLLSSPVLEEFDMKAANRPVEVKVEGDGE
jgi:hypothetical protein